MARKPYQVEKKLGPKEKRRSLYEAAASVSAMSPASLGGLIQTLPDNGVQIVPHKKRKKIGYVATNDQYRDMMLDAPARLQYLYQSSLFKDSVGDKDSRFGQLEGRLLDEGTPSESRLGLDRALASDRAGRQSDVAYGAAQRAVRASGITDVDQTALLARRAQLSRTLNRVDAANNAMVANDQRREMVRDYSFDAEGLQQNIVGRGLAAATGAQLTRRLGKKAESAAAASGNAQLGGQLAGMAISAFAASDVNLKSDVTAIGDGEILEGLRQLDVSRWHYTGSTELHIGPMAQDFQRVFGIGDGRTLKLVDVMGVMIGALRELAIAEQQKG